MTLISVPAARPAHLTATTALILSSSSRPQSEMSVSQLLVITRMVSICQLWVIVVAALAHQNPPRPHLPNHLMLLPKSKQLLISSQLNQSRPRRPLRSRRRRQRSFLQLPSRRISLLTLFVMLSLMVPSWHQTPSSSKPGIFATAVARPGPLDALSSSLGATICVLLIPSTQPVFTSLSLLPRAPLATLRLPQVKRLDSPS